MDARRERLTLLAMCFGLFMIMLDNTIGAGVRTLPWTLMILVVAPVAGRLGARIGARGPAAVGMLLLSAGLVGLAELDADTAYSSIWPSFVLCGVGTALAMPTLSAAAMGAIAAERAGVASGVLNTARQIGGALGIAVLGAVATARITSHWADFVATAPSALRPHAAQLGELADGGQLQAIARLAGPGAREAASSAFMAGFHGAMWSAAALAFAAAIVAAVGLRGTRTAAQGSAVPA